MPITLAQATAALEAWREADLATAKGQEYSIGTRTLTRVDADLITQKINYWSNVEASLQRHAAGAPRTSFAKAKFT